MKGQESYIIGLGFAIAVIISILTTDYFISHFGTSMEMKQAIPKAVYGNEKIVSLLRQERQYEFEKSLLIAGISGCYGDHGEKFIYPNESFPFIPAKYINYWKYNGQLYIPNESSFKSEITKMLSKKNFIRPSEVLGKTINSFFSVPLTKDGDHFTGIISKPYLPRNFTIICYQEIVSIGSEQVPLWFCNVTDESNNFIAKIVEGGSSEVIETFPTQIKLKLVGIETSNNKGIANLAFDDIIFYYVYEKEFKIEEFKIGDIPKFGLMEYVIVPIDDVKIQSIADLGKFKVSVASNLLFHVKDRYFPTLYQVAKEFVSGEYGYGKIYNGWMEAELDNQIRNKLEAIELASLKVFTHSDLGIIPKHDWKTRLIWALSLIGTNYTYADLDKVSKKCLVFEGDTGVIINDYNGKGYCDCNEYRSSNPGKICIQIYNCTNTEKCNNMLKEAITAEFERIFEQVAPAKLESYTTFPWKIKIRNVTVKVRNLCTDEEIKVNIEKEDTFESTGKSHVLGLPLQILFAEKSNISLKPDKAGLICLYDEQNTDKVGAICLDNDEFGCYYDNSLVNSQDLIDYYKNKEPCKSSSDPENCAKEKITNIAHLTCNTRNFCCPIGWEETLKDEDGFRCCKLDKIERSEPVEIAKGIIENNVKKYYKCLFENGDIQEVVVEGKAIASYNMYRVGFLNYYSISHYERIEVK